VGLEPIWVLVPATAPRAFLIKEALLRKLDWSFTKTRVDEPALLNAANVQNQRRFVSL
jgi:hypothetical protein